MSASSTSHVLAHHAHVFPQSVNPNGTIDRLLRLLDACGIDRAVCLPPFPHHHYRTKPCTVRGFDEIACTFPRLRPSLEHVGGSSFFRGARAVIVNNIPFPPRPGERPRVFGGLTSVFTQHYNRFWYLPPERLAE